ncbi:MAG TPA: phosphoribosyltransferase family protein [Pusillimonas sp.]|uniref:orotate phosphoribosyltransferase n=1 Tax=Pusillimonas sp. TaxID=3040095 RepID=UPI002CAF79AE|nr:phosphoribosyltransferase family protein [Pusillimonas sp.]HUH86444.1 phosphoribosyltransferase family protein [Pusillimonas sp.]
MQPTPDTDAKTVAAALLDAGCVTARTDEPFRLPSGWASPVYIDCRRLISFPALRRDLIKRAQAMLQARGALDGVESVVGGEASGIALAAWLAEALDLPLQYVRKKQVGQSQIEGVLKPGSKVLLVDDMMAGGQSKLRFCQALAASNVQVQDLFIVFDYATFPTQQLLGPLGVRVHSLATWRDILAVAQQRNDFSAHELNELAEFLRDPAAWSARRGGRASYSDVVPPK